MEGPRTPKPISEHWAKSPILLWEQAIQRSEGTGSSPTEAMEFIECPQTNEQCPCTYGPRPNPGSVPGISRERIPELPRVSRTSRCTRRMRESTELPAPLLIPHAKRRMLRMWHNEPLGSK